MQFVQPLLTDEQALLTRLAIDLILQDPERYEMTDEERADYERLAVFFGYVAANPRSFAPTGAMARTVKRIVRNARKGAAQPQSRSKRKLKRSQGQQKRDRAARREAVAQFNAAREAYERDRADHEAYMEELRSKYEDAPKFTIVNEAGQVVLSGVPEYALKREDEEAELAIAPAPKIVLPGNVEKAMQREAAEVIADEIKYGDPGQ